jgi:hypothetical protein
MSLAQGLVEECVARRAERLGVIHRGVGLADGVVQSVRVGDSHRGRDVCRCGAQGERFVRPIDDAAGQRLCSAAIAAGQHDELVTGVPDHGVGGAECGADASCRGDDEFVTDAVTVRVVDHLEVVEVDEQNACASRSLAALEPGEFLVEHRAVR